MSEDCAFTEFLSLMYMFGHMMTDGRVFGV